jgi:dipeptidase E
MPIVEVPTLDTFGVLPFQINAHFIDADPNSTHMGETREKRIEEYHEENDLPVLGLREGTWLEVGGGNITLEGSQNAKLFMKGGQTKFFEPGEVIEI